MGKGFASPTQFRGDDIKNALIRNWRQLVTFINTWVVTYDADAATLALPGDVTVAGDLTVTGTFGGSAYAEMNVTTPAATTPPDTTNFTKVLGTTTLGQASNFTMPASNRLTLGGDGGDFHVIVAVDFSAGAANQTVDWRLAKNGTTISTTNMRITHGTAANDSVVVLAVILSLATSDYIEVFLRNATSTNTITANEMHVVVTRP